MVDASSVCAAREELKTQFMTREGLYRMMASAEYSRPNRSAYTATGATAVTGIHAAIGGASASSAAANANSAANNPANIPVRVSFSPASVRGSGSGGGSSNCSDDGSGSNVSLVRGEKIVFNYGREIFVYPYRGVKKAADLSKPIDKRIYKGTCPTCHDFGSVTDSDIVPLLVGFSGGQIQLIDPVRKELSKLYNEERLIEKSRVTCVRWMPGSPNLFLVSYASGNMYVYNHELACTPTAPVYQMFKAGAEGGFAVYTCKAKTTRNPLYKWSVGQGAINEFAFSPCGHFLAVVSQDGYLRIFNHDTMELVGIAKSYFGGLLCACWSPDGKYVVVGGEDDLVTVYSVVEKRVVARGQGHKSWVAVVAFDPYNVSYGDEVVPDGLDFSGSDEEDNNGHHSPAPGSHNGHIGGRQRRGVNASDPRTKSGSPSVGSAGGTDHVACYRFGSVGEDTLLCLWDLTEDVLKKTSLSACPSKNASHSSLDTNYQKGSSTKNPSTVTSLGSSRDSGVMDNGGSTISTGSTNAAHTNSASTNNGTSLSSAASSASTTSLTQRFASFNFGDRNKEHKRNLTLPSRGGSGSDKGSSSKPEKASSSSTASASVSTSASTLQMEQVRLGTPQCPRLNEVPLMEPLVMKKVAHERLTSLIFREDCFVTACQEGYVCTWARPGRANGNYCSSLGPGSPQGAPSSGGVSGSGTVV